MGKLIPKIEAFEGGLTPKGAGSAFMGNDYSDENNKYVLVVLIWI